MLKNKHLFIFLFFSLLSSLLFSQKVNDWVRMGLKGEVSNLRESKHFVPKNGNNTMHEFSDILYNFNREGNITSIELYQNNKLALVKRYTYHFDSNKVVEKRYFPNGTLFLRILYKTDEFGNRTHGIVDRSLQKQYDGSGNPIDVEYVKYYEEQYNEVIFQVDEKGLIWEERYLNPDGSLHHKVNNTYNYLSRKLTSKYYNNEGHLSWKKKYRYEKKQKLSECKKYIDNRLAVKSKYSYKTDQQDNWTMRKEDRTVYRNIFTADISDDTVIIQRSFTYY